MSPKTSFATLPDQIAQKLSDDIAVGIYKPGDRIPEMDISRALHVSRAPIREALRILERDGLVSIFPNRGARVVLVSRQELEETFVVRKLLFAWVVERIISKNSAAEFKIIDANVATLELLAEQTDSDIEYMQAVYRLPRLIADLAGNEKLSQILQSLNRQTFRFRRPRLETREGRIESARRWRAFADAVRDRNIGQANSIILEMMEGTFRDAVASLG